VRLRIAARFDKLEEVNWDELKQLSDRELLGEAARELLMITILASRALQNQISSLMRPQKFLEVTNLIKALSVCFKTGFVDRPCGRDETIISDKLTSSSPRVLCRRSKTMT
jgi:hypothetical protein